VEYAKTTKVKEHEERTQFLEAQERRRQEAAQDRYRQRKALESAERAEYERLKAKFEPSSGGSGGKGPFKTEGGASA
jgi:hypothetical protein